MFAMAVLFASMAVIGVWCVVRATLLGEFTKGVRA